MKQRNREWKIEYDIPDIPQSLLDAGYTPLLSAILTTRDIKTPEDARKFFSGEETLLSPYDMKGMEEAVSRIRRAVEAHDRVAVYGDYDVDGITATCLLTGYLRSKGLEVTPYIPDRTEEGYGLNCAALDTFSSSGINLVITVDCGITAEEEAAHASSLGIDMIVTDHHECKSEHLPEARAVIDCKQPGDTYGNPNLAGVGVAFKLACAVEGDAEKVLEEYADFVAIGTVADVMPLNGENRYLVMRGLEMIRTSPRPGLEAMMKRSGIDCSSITASSIGYTLAPRLNAAGRLGHAITAGNLLMSSDERETSLLADELCELNRRRQSIENEIWSEAAKIIDKSVPDAPLVLASEKWHQGVIGIAASRLAEHYALPTIMINLNGEKGKGSCRSYGGFNLFDALNACSEHLESFGGHALAAGLNIKADKVAQFREALTRYYCENRPEPQPEIICDLLITDSSLLSEENVRSLDLLEPYGNSNPRPVLCLQAVRLLKAQEVGGGRHLKMLVSAGGLKYDCIFFGHTAKEQGVHEGDILDIAFTPQINEFRGTTSVQLQLISIREHSAQELCSNILSENCSYKKAAAAFMPGRQDFVKAWKHLGKDFTIGGDADTVIAMCPEDMAPETFCICLEVFRQAGLLSGENVFGAKENKLEDKADLDETPLMKALHIM